MLPCHIVHLRAYQDCVVTKQDDLKLPIRKQAGDNLSHLLAFRLRIE
jgi:hypothetical protein